MKSFLEKFIALILILGLFVGLGLNIFITKPNKAQAAAISGDFILQIKEYILDAVGNVISNMVLKRLEQNIYDWGTGRKSSIRLPFGIEDFNDYFDEFLNVASAKFIEGFKMTELCTGISTSLLGVPLRLSTTGASIGQSPSGDLSNILSAGRNMGRFSATFGRYYTDRPTYQQMAGCTLDKVVNNIESFIKRPRISVFGWDAWKALNQPQNNIFGAFFSALDYKTQLEIKETMNATNKAAVSGGYKNQETTTANSRDNCKAACQAGTGLKTCETEEEMPGMGTLGDTCSSTDECDANQACQGGRCVSTLTTGSSDACESDKAACISNCSRIPFVPLATAISNLGSSIHASLDKALGADLSRIINVSEITQLAGIFFQALFNKAINGMGLAFNSLKATPNQQNRSQVRDNYSYLRQFDKTTVGTTTKRDARANIVASLDRSIQQFNRGIVSCNSDEMMTYQDWRKNITDILQSNVEGLYVGIAGVNIQPDIVTLDPPYAPYPVYGYSWGEVFPTKVPGKCRALLTKLNMLSNSTCSDIISGLEPNYGLEETETSTTTQCNDSIDNDGDGLIDYPNDTGCSSALDNSEGTGSGGGKGDVCEFDPSLPQCPGRTPYAMDLIPGFGNSPCIPCMYDHDALNCPRGPVPPQPYPSVTGSSFFDSVLGRVGTITASTVWTSAILQQKNELRDSCTGPYTTALLRCDACVKAFDEKCANLNTAEEKSNCIERNCNNYADVVDIVIDPPTSALDFYGKCLIEEQKDACFSCLKEYYMPATYCEQLRDYVARMVIKYPAITVNKYAKNEGEFRGLYDQSIAAMGGLCNDNDGAEPISIALICRALPDFSYQGAKICASRCNHGTLPMTTAQLTDVTDFRPDEADCNNETLPAHTGNAGGGTADGVGGKMPFADIDAGVLATRGTCCADFWQKDRRNYQTCVGAGATTEQGGGGTVIPLSVALSATPSSGPAPLNSVNLTATVTGAQTGENLTYNFDCDNDGTFEGIFTTPQTTYTYTTTTNLCNYTANNITYTATVTIMTEVGLTADATTNIRTTDCEINFTLDPASGIVPANVNITAGLNNFDTGPFTYVFYCDVPITGGDISTWQGASIEHVVSNNPYTLNAACNITDARTRGIGVWIRSSTTDTSCYKVTNTFQTPTISCNMSSSTTSTGRTTLTTTALPDAIFSASIGTTSGITFSYDCDGDGNYSDVMHTRNAYTDSNTECSSYYTEPTMYNVGVRVRGTAPSGLSAEGECYTDVEIPQGTTNPTNPIP